MVMGLFSWRHIRLRRRLAPRIRRDVGVIRFVEHGGGCWVVGREHGAPVTRRNDHAVIQNVGVFANSDAAVGLDVKLADVSNFG